MRIPADPQDVRARVNGLVRRADDLRQSSPRIDDDGQFRYFGQTVSFPPVEARIVAVLVNEIGTVVPGRRLMDEGWPDESVKRNTLDVRISRIRHRLETTGLSLRTVRSRGYLLERD